MIATEELTVQNCYKCSITFAVPKTFDDRRLKDHKAFYCPAGHPQGYVGKTPEQKLRERLKEAERKLQTQHYDEVFNKRTVAALKGHITRLKNKAL